ncbi:MAG TPA: hypothetical protein VF405_03265 [Gammaproteobacteria bacterium]
MDFLVYVAIYQAFVWVAFSVLAVGGAFAQRRWGWRASVAVVVLSWPVFMAATLLAELRTIPQLLELNSLLVLVRNLWVPPTLATVALAVSLWLVRRATSNRRLVLQGIGAGAVWAFVMPVPLLFVGLWLASVIPAGTAEFHYIDFRPMGLEVLETGTPSLSHYTGGEMPVRYRAELDGRELEVIVGTLTGTPEIRIRAVTPDSPLFELDEASVGRCSFGSVRPSNNTIHVEWSMVPALRGRCYGEGAPDAEVTFRFAGSETSLTLHGPIVKGGEYSYYDSL